MMVSEIINVRSQPFSHLKEQYAHLINAYRQSPPALARINSQTLSVLEVNFDAIAYNYQSLKQHYTGEICAAVVKCDAYGVGAVAVARKLYSVGCRHFFVANCDEGIELRQALSEGAAIYIFSGVIPHTEDLLVRYNLTPVIINIHGLRLWQTFARQVGKKLPAVIHVDTGMNRTGFHLDLLKKMRFPDDFAGIDVRVVMSHLACSPNPDHNLNHQQLQVFNEATSFFPGVKRSLLNSEGIFLPKEYHFDMARPGGGLYGFNSSNLEMVPALRFWTRVLHIHPVKKGETVGYGGAFRFKHDGCVAVLAAGYYHGWVRNLSSRAEVYIAGRKARVVGPISMDLCMVDVTDIPENELSLHSWVELAGQHVPLRQLAKDGGSITTELITFISRTQNRIYVGAPDEK